MKIATYRNIMPDDNDRPWFFDQSFFNTTVNGKPVCFLLCKSRFPGKLR